MTLPTMRKGKHWAWIGVSFVVCPILAFIAFMIVPMLGLFIIPIPAILTIASIVLYYKKSKFKE